MVDLLVKQSKISSHRGHKTVIIYLDDFLIIAKSKEECVTALRVLCLMFMGEVRRTLGDTTSSKLPI